MGETSVKCKIPKKTVEKTPKFSSMVSFCWNPKLEISKRVLRVFFWCITGFLNRLFVFNTWPVEIEIKLDKDPLQFQEEKLLLVLRSSRLLSPASAFTFLSIFGMTANFFLLRVVDVLGARSSFLDSDFVGVVDLKWS